MAESKYRVRIKNQEFEVEIESTDKAFVEKKLKDYSVVSFEGSTRKSGASSETQKSSSSASGKKLSIQEFVKTVKPKGGPQHAIAAIYYLETHGGQPDASTSDVTAAFKTIRFKSTNVTRDVLTAKSQGYVMNGNTKRTWVVTNTGQEWVQGRISPGDL